MDQPRGHNNLLTESPASTRRARLRELAEWGIDLSLSWSQLAKSPGQCLDELQAMADFKLAVDRAHHQRSRSV